MNVDYGSVCSGIEAASIAWEPFGWKARWFAEIESFPSKVLKHRWPEVPNLGDMTKIAVSVRSGAVSAPSVLVGGTPCQSFSLAGRRQGLLDGRGQLTLAYVDLLDAIDERRASEGNEPCVAVWENVPGVLTSSDNAFGCLLAALAGDEEPVEPGPRPEQGRSSAHWTWDKKAGVHRAKWSDAGHVVGPKRTIAWVVKDAQYFGLAQRRRRVFLVASAREGFDPAEILFEFDGVRRDSAPSREAREEIAGTLDARTEGGGFPGTEGACSNHVIGVQRHIGLAFGGGNCSGPIAAAAALNANERYDFDSETFVLGEPIPILEAGARTGVSTTDVRAGIGIGSSGDPMYTLQAGKQHAIAFFEDVAGTMKSCANSGGWTNSADHAAAGYMVPVCVTGDITHTLKADGFDGSEDGTGRGQPIIAFSPKIGGNPTMGLGVKKDGTAYTLDANGHSTAIAYGFQTRIARNGRGDMGDVVNALTAQAGDTGKGDAAPCVATSMAVRRLTPTECERLQGFPDGHTDIPDGNKRSADGPRYKALGNSMATNCMAWIGWRLDRYFQQQEFKDILG